MIRPVVDEMMIPKHRRHGSPSRFFVNTIYCIVFATMLAPIPAALARQTVRITGDRLSGFVLPISPIDNDITIEAMRVNSWTVDDTKRLLLEGDVHVSIGSYEFDSSAAVVWINRIPSASGVINQIAIYFDEVQGATRRAGQMGAGGRELLITASSRGAVNLTAWSHDPRRPRGSVLLKQAEGRLSVHLRRLLALEDELTLSLQPRIERPPPRKEDYVPVPGGRPTAADIELPQEIKLPSLEDITPWLRDPAGSITYIAERVAYTPGTDEDIITLSGTFVIEYIANLRANDFSQITLSAQRAVIFIDPGLTSGAGSGRLSADSIRGVYLEGNVVASADDGDYTTRAPRMYYDFKTGQAVMLEAVLRTYLRDSSLPIYARAKELRQIASNQWKAKNVVVSTSEFFTPHLAIGAERMTITRRPAFANPDEKETYLVSESNTMQVGGTPIFWWPSFKGTLRSIPLRSVSFGTRNNDGLRLHTSSDLFSLMGLEEPAGIEARLDLDYFSKRGAGVGLNVDYELNSGKGEIDLYGIKDDGIDRTSSGLEVDQNGAFRGVALWEHQSDWLPNWTFQSQIAYISDETFIDAWRPADFRTRREYETSFYLKHQLDNVAFSVLGQWDLNDFISNDYLLASRGYQVNRMPEIAYRRYGDTLLGDSVTYSSEYSVSRIQFVFEKHTARQLGIRPGAFGIGIDVPIENALLARGLTTRWVTRFDTRHEFALPLVIGNLNITPFVVGRVTMYDDDFLEFSPTEMEKMRTFGAAGLRASAQFQHIDNAVEDRLFDLHRLRHIFEPNVTVWFGHSDVSEDDLPEFDPEVESLGTGSVIRAGMRNVWQTQRGGPGRWRSVDVLTLDTGVVYNSNDANRESPTPQFFDYRPEYSQFGDHAYGTVAWLLSDSLSVVGQGTYDLENSNISRASIGAEMRHSPLLSSYVEYRLLRASQNELLGVGINYLLTPKYRVSISPQWDFKEEEFRAITGRIQRQFPDFTLSTIVRYDQIRDETTFSASIDLVEF